MNAYETLTEVLNDGPGMNAFRTTEEALRAAADVWAESMDATEDDAWRMFTQAMGFLNNNW